MDRVAGLLVGADDYICKPFAPDELVARVMRPLVRTSAPAGNRAGAGNRNGDVLTQLTKRESEIFRLLAEGKRPKAIAAELHISPKTVATHIQRILTKLGVHSRAEAVSLAYRHGLVSPDIVAHGLAGDDLVWAS